MPLYQTLNKVNSKHFNNVVEPLIQNIDTLIGSIQQLQNDQNQLGDATILVNQFTSTTIQLLNDKILSEINFYDLYNTDPKVNVYTYMMYYCDGSTSKDPFMETPYGSKKTKLFIIDLTDFATNVENTLQGTTWVNTDLVSDVIIVLTKVKNNFLAAQTLLESMA